VGLRETLNENPRLTTGVTAGIIVVVLAFILWPSGGGGGGGAAGGDNQIYFTVDDGKTYFPESAKKVPPFQHQGKEAVRARVYRAGGKEFVNHLERFTPDAAKKLQELYNSGKPMNDPTVFEAITQKGMEVKNPGSGNWVKTSDPASTKIMQPKSTGQDLEEIFP
jgi:hypothetical protein